MEKRSFVIWFMAILGNAAFIYLIVRSFFVLRKEWFRKLFLFFACGLLDVMVIYFGDWANLPPTLLIFLLAVWQGCRGSRLKRITLGMLLASTVFASNGLCDSYSAELSVRAFFRLGYAALLFLGVKHQAPRRDFELPFALWRLFLLLILTPIGVVLSVVLLGEHGSDRTLQMVLMGISAFSFAGLLWTVTVLFKQGRLEEEQAQAQMSRKYYEAMEQQNFEIRRLKHDLANHLQVLSTLPPEKKDAYIKELLDTPSLTRILKYCSDDTVNVILSNKAAVMAQKEIEFYVKADIPCELPLEKTDVCAVFGNALDNAIEASAALPKEERRICLETHFSRGMFVLSVENTCAPDAKGALGETTKEDKSMHGYGLKSIRSAAEKYGGSLEIKVENRSFRLLFYCSP